LTIQYNYFYGTPQDVIDITDPKSGSATLVIRYNLFDVHGYHGHADVVQFNGGNFTGSAVNFNTHNNPYIDASSPGTQAFHIKAQLTAAIAQTTVAFNTLIASGSCNGGRSFPVGFSANIGIFLKAELRQQFQFPLLRLRKLYRLVRRDCRAQQQIRLPAQYVGRPLPNVDLKTGSAIIVNQFDGATAPIKRGLGRKGS
jgi:hypothetical protein